MQPNGFSGADLYWYNSTSSTWRWVAVTFVGLENAPGAGYVVAEAPFYANSTGWPSGPVPSSPLAPFTSRFRLNLPSFNGVSNVWIGTPSGATIQPDTTTIGTTVVYYGSTAAQGVVTARPGQTFANTLSRNALINVVNMGFQNGCLLDNATWTWVSSVSANIYFIDCGWDADATTIQANIPTMVASLRAQQPNAWVVLVEPTPYGPSWITGDIYNIAEKTAATAAAYNSLRKQGVQYIAYVNASSLYAGIAEDPTSDGILPMDKAHENIAQVLQAVVRAPTEFTPAYVEKPMVHADTHTAKAADAPSCSDSIAWMAATELNIVGRAFNDTPTPYNRLPAAAEGVVRSAVWGLSLDSAGLFVAFQTDAPIIYVNYAAVSSFYPMVHFSTTGVSGIDLFGMAPNGNLTFISSADLVQGQNTFCGPLLSTRAAGNAATQFVMYFPTYNEAKSVEVGVPTGYTATPWNVFSESRGKVVWYGTSILQGAAAYRTGGIFTSIISRRINREIYNFGFSGNGEMEISVAEFLINIPTPAVFIVDCNKNMGASQITNNTIPLVNYLRRAYPNMPIVLTEGTQFGRDFMSADIDENDVTDNAALLQAYNTLIGNGVQNLHYVTYTQLFSSAHLYNTPTSAGLHPTASGIEDMADFWSSYLPTIIGA
jgi:hypothetical protein